MVEGMQKTSTTMKEGARALRIPGRGWYWLMFGGASSFCPPLLRCWSGDGSRLSQNCLSYI